MTLKEIFRLLVDHSLGRILSLLAHWRHQDSRHAEQESFASRYTVLLIEIGRLRSALPQFIRNWISGKSSFVPRNLVGADCRRGFYLDRNRAGGLGPLSPGGVLERAGHHQRGPPTHPHRPVCAPAPSDLFRPYPCDDWVGDGHRQVAMRAGGLPGGGGISASKRRRKNPCSPSNSARLSASTRNTPAS